MRIKKRYHLKKEIKEELNNLCLDIFGIITILLMIQLLVVINLMVF